MSEDHAIFVGGKPFMNYVTAVVMQFTTKGADQVTIRSRGKFISRAVDVAEVVKSRFLRDQIDVDKISMDSEEFKNKEGRTVRVSTLDIALKRIIKLEKQEDVETVKEEIVSEPVVEKPAAVEETVKETVVEEAPAPAVVEEKVEEAPVVEAVVEAPAKEEPKAAEVPEKEAVVEKPVAEAKVEDVETVKEKAPLTE